jgi:hypothetical protein
VNLQRVAQGAVGWLAGAGVLKGIPDISKQISVVAFLLDALQIGERKGSARARKRPSWIVALARAWHRHAVLVMVSVVA